MSSLKKYFLPILLFIGLVILYTHNLSRAVYAGDVGDLITAAVVMGVPHPPGYPLFTLLGFLLTRIHFMPPAFMVGLISVVSSSLAVVIFYFLTLKLTQNKLISAVASLALAFSYLFWFYSEIAEVFALNNFFALLLMFIAVILREKKKLKFLYLFVFVAGLAFSHHQTIALVFPGLFILLAPTVFKLFKKKPAAIFYSLMLLISGFVFYLYVPFASSKNPVINWDNVKDIHSFLRLFLRQDYGTFKAGIFDLPNLAQRIVILKTYLFVLISQVSIPVFVISLVGFAYLFIKDKLLFLSLAVIFLLSGPLFIFYAGFPLYGGFFIGVYERFFILSSLFIFIPFGIGVKVLSSRLSGIFKKSDFSLLFSGIFLMIPLLLFIYNFPKTNLSNVDLGNKVAMDVLSPLPRNSFIFLSGDTLLFNVWYVHYGLNYRPDITVINYNAINESPIFRKAREEINKKYPKEKREDVLVIKTIEEVNKKYPVISITQLQGREKEDRLNWVPFGLTYMLSGNPSEAKFKDKTDKLWKNIHLPLSKSLALSNLSLSDIPSAYITGLLATGNYYVSQYGDKKEGLKFYNKALEIDPNYNKTNEVLGTYYLSVDKNCLAAKKYLEKALYFDSFNKLPYFLLYETYNNCLKDKKAADSLLKDYSDKFKTDFLKDVKESIKEANK